MWIEVKYGKERSLINSNAVVRITVNDDNVTFDIAGMSNFTIVEKSQELLNVIYEGFILALNGLDCVIEGYGYIKPMKAAKNDSFMRYMMLQEHLGDRK